MIDANCVLVICPHFEVRFLEDEDLILLQDNLSWADMFRFLKIQCKGIRGALFVFNHILLDMLVNFWVQQDLQRRNKVGSRFSTVVMSKRKV
jgi:hypothetical protein